MNTTETTWIKMSERKPTNADLPFALWDVRRQKTDIRERVLPFESETQFTHWAKVALPPPPPRELTQREKDYVAADAYLNKTAFNGGIGYLITKAHIAGKYDERREVLEALDALWIEAYGCRFIGESAPRHPLWIKFRARLEEQSQSK